MSREWLGECLGNGYPKQGVKLSCRHFVRHSLAPSLLTFSIMAAYTELKEKCVFLLLYTVDTLVIAF